MLLATSVLSVNVVGLVLGDLQRSVAIAHTASLRLAGALRSLEDVAHLDPTTQVANRRRLDEVLHAEWHRATRDRLPLSFLLMDVDHFKSYNDRYGHLAGDECLRLIAQIVASVVQRSADVVARFGGEEFAIVLPNTSELGANEIASKVRDALCAAAIAHEGTPAKFVTLSIGCATAQPTRDTAVITLIAAADEALYQAKREGRDRIVAQSSLSPDLPARVLT